MALGRTVNELETSLSSSEFAEWMAYYTIEPFGQWRDNLHAAQITAMLYNINRGNGSALGVDDFMYLDDVAAQEKQDREFISRMTAVALRKTPNG